MIKTVLAQLAPVLYNKETNLKKIETTVKSTKPDLIVFGELFLTGYMVRDTLPNLAEEIEGKSVQRITKIAEEYGCNIIVGFPERCKTRRGLVYNSSLLVQPNGKADSYKKINLANFGPFEEKQYFASGNSLPLFKTNVGKIGMMICYDTFFPEIAKTYALKGADMVICISASPSSTRVFFENVIVARAIENTTFILYSNIVGTELNMVFWGGSFAVGPRGDVLAKGKYYKEDLVETNLDLKDLEIARHFRPTLKNTRSDIIDEMKKSIQAP